MDAHVRIRASTQSRRRQRHDASTAPVSPNIGPPVVRALATTAGRGTL